jgi:hypothetical protein
MTPESHVRFVVGGYRYDTATAERIGYRFGGDGPGAYIEALWRTPKSHRYFLVGQGGSATRWGRPSESGRSRSADRGVQPISEDEAVWWMRLPDVRVSP